MPSEPSGARTAEPGGAVGHLRNPAALRGAPFPAALADLLPPAACRRAQRTVRRWPGYAPTPLRSLPGLARALGVAALSYKDEGERFGLGSFKALGGAYAVARLLQREVAARGGPVPRADELDTDRQAAAVREVAAGITVAAATDGNHGRAVAWGARRFGCRCVIYLHAGVSEGRAAALRALGARVVRVDGDYDASVRRAAHDAERHGWFVVSDTAYPGCTELPREVMAGYTLLAAEALEQLTAAGEALPSHVFVPGGVGGLAAALCAQWWRRLGAARPQLVVVEPERAACLFHSARSGALASVRVERESVMAGLSCGEPSLLAWPILEAGAEHFATLPDALVAPAMRLLADAPHGDPPIVAGESAVAGLCALRAAREDPKLAAALRLDARSRVLLVGTEGATDPRIYRELVGRTPEEVRAGG